MKRVILWIIGIFFMITFGIYVNQIMFQATLMLVVGIILLPPINDMIERKIEDVNRIKIYNVFRNIIAVILFIVFFANVPTNNVEKNHDSVSTINQAKVDNSITLVMTEENGKYTGERIDGKKSGNGKFEWNTGEVYEGEFSEDKISGKGKLTFPKQGTYEGEFLNGKRNGQGSYKFINGDEYQGNWEDDKMSGQGSYKFLNGDIYEGTFSNNKFNGQGTYTKGKNKYTGTWTDNEYKK